MGIPRMRRGLLALALVVAACSLEQEALVQELKDNQPHGVNSLVAAALAATENAGAVANDLGDANANTETGLVKLVDEAEDATALSVPHQEKFDDYTTEAKVERAMRLTKAVEAPMKAELKEANDETAEGKVDTAMEQTRNVAALGDAPSRGENTDALVHKAMAATTSFAEDKQDVGDSAKDDATIVARALSATEVASDGKHPKQSLKKEVKDAMKATANDVETPDSMKDTPKKVRQATEAAVLPTLAAKKQQLGEVKDEDEKAESTDAAEAMAVAATEVAAEP